MRSSECSPTASSRERLGGGRAPERRSLARDSRSEYAERIAEVVGSTLRAK